MLLLLLLLVVVLIDLLLLLLLLLVLIDLRTYALKHRSVRRKSLLSVTNLVATDGVMLIRIFVPGSNNETPADRFVRYMCSILSIMLSNLCKSLGSIRNRSSVPKKRRTSRGDTKLRILRWCCKISTKSVFAVHTPAVLFRLTVAGMDVCVFFIWP